MYIYTYIYIHYIIYTWSWYIYTRRSSFAALSPCWNCAGTWTTWRTLTCGTCLGALRLCAPLGMWVWSWASLAHESTACFADLARIKQDGGIDCVILAIYWHFALVGSALSHGGISRTKTTGPCTVVAEAICNPWQTPFVLQINDVVCRSQTVGVGLDLAVDQFKLYVCLAQIGWIARLGSLGQGTAEFIWHARSCTHCQGVADWSEDIVRRYLQVAGMLHDSCKEILTKCEYGFRLICLLGIDHRTHKRGAISWRTCEWDNVERSRPWSQSDRRHSLVQVLLRHMCYQYG